MKSAALERLMKLPAPVRRDVARVFMDLSNELLQAEPPKLERRAAQIAKLEAAGISEKAICERLGISRATFFRDKLLELDSSLRVSKTGLPDETA